jgi:tryptophanyl-tRNA synthetase
VTTPPIENEKLRVLSGMRPTGKLHLGNYMGALHNWVGLQDKHECYFFIADYHALTTDYADPSNVKQNTLEVAMDFLAAGLDPEKSVLFIQSHVVQHAELHLLLSMITSLGWLERVPSYKEQQENIVGKDLTTYGFLGYPLLQSADILVYQAHFVPVGQDQAAHVELTREVARRFNFFYGRRPSQSPARELSHSDLPENLIDRMQVQRHGGPMAARTFTLRDVNEAADMGDLFGYGREVLREPQALLTPSPKLPGTDGRKMSKSYGNFILLTDPEEEIRKKLKTMVTDPARAKRSDKGTPEKCPVWDLHKVFSSKETQMKVHDGCITAGIGCIECKGWAADAIIEHVKPIQERRKPYEANPELVWEILEDGSAKARKRAEQTMVEVRDVMGLARRRGSIGV